MKKVLGSCAMVLAVTGCGKKSSGSGSALTAYPAVGALALEALPASLKPTTLATRQQLMGLEDFAIHPFSITTNDATVMQDFGYLFTDNYNTISGGTYVGFINSLLQDMDSRFAGLSKQFSTTPTCASNDAKTYTVDLTGAVDAATLTSYPTLATTLKVSLDVQCYDLFSGTGSDVSGTGSGLLYGNKGSDYSIMLVLNAKDETSSGFGYAAKVTDKDADDETVDMIFGQGRPTSGTGGNDEQVIRVRAQRKKKIYEFATASTSGQTTVSAATGHHNPYFGCGSRGITDGTLIYVNGFSGQGCDITKVGSAADSFELCLNASDLSANNTASACDTLKGSMNIGKIEDLEYLNAHEIRKDTTDDQTALYNAIQINTDAVKAAAASDNPTNAL